MVVGSKLRKKTEPFVTGNSAISLRQPTIKDPFNCYPHLKDRTHVYYVVVWSCWFGPIFIVHSSPESPWPH